MRRSAEHEPPDRETSMEDLFALTLAALVVIAALSVAVGFPLIMLATPIGVGLALVVIFFGPLC
jgi:hypothetical protein